MYLSLAIINVFLLTIKPVTSTNLRAGSSAPQKPRKLTTSNTAGTNENENPLTSTGCYPPVAEGGWGFCGPESCKNNYITCKAYDTFGVYIGGGPATVDGVTGEWISEANGGSSCGTFLQRSSIPDLSIWNPNGSCKSSCVQNSHEHCSSEFLAGVLTGDGVKYAYCNDNWLVVGASGLPR